MLTAFPCGICLNPVAKNHKAVKCDNCDLWIHIKCNKINVQTYNLLINDNTVWYCLTCSMIVTFIQLFKIKQSNPSLEKEAP